MSKEFPASVGQNVNWYQGGVKDPTHAYPALVMRVHENSLSVRVHTEFKDTFIESVRHVSDPLMKEDDRVCFGGWDYSEPPIYARTRFTGNDQPPKGK